MDIYQRIHIINNVFYYNKIEVKGTYERPEKYVSKKNKTRKIKKNYL